MPAPKKLSKAEMQEITWLESENGPPQVQTLEKKVSVQFNPESLKLALSNQKAGGDQRGGSASQFVGQGSTKLTFDLWFDVTAPEPDQATGEAADMSDVRLMLRDIEYFMTPKKEGDQFIAPGVRFLWGTFLFEGSMESLNETIEYFAEDGRPLRASAAISLSKQEISFQYNPQPQPGAPAGQAPAGTRPQTPAVSGDSVQSMAAAQGRQDRWQQIAAANDVENPRRLPAGSTLDLGAAGPGGTTSVPPPATAAAPFRSTPR